MSGVQKAVVAVVVLLAVIAVVDFALNRGNSRVTSALQTVRDTAVDQYARLTGQPTRPETPPTPAAETTEARPRRVIPRPAAPSTSVAAPPVETPPAAAAAPPPAVSAPTVAAPAPAPPVVRGAYFLPGRTPTWTSFDITFSTPIVIRAGGRVEAGTDASGPDGLKASYFERGLDRRQGTSERVVPSAAYLALIGRICSASTCSEPFVVGSNAVLCPSDVKMTGSLQLWTNNYVRVEGTQTSLNYSNASGGYSFYVEPAPEGLCATGAARPAGMASSIDTEALDAGQTLRNPEFVISSSQSSWKPFFLPLTSPLRLRASGSMQPRGGVEATDPRGIVVPNAATWSYPGTRDVVVDGEHRLYDPSLPYQGLIGRLCGSAGCSVPFLVGSEYVICPTPPFSDRLELWINHIIGPAGLLGRQTPLTLDALELQQRRGSYRFEISRAPATACAG
jgi:hypothetical protein